MHRRRSIDDPVFGGRRVVVGVAAVAAVDVPVGTLDAQAVDRDRQRAVVGVDVDLHVLVGERASLGPDRGRGPVALLDPVRAPAEAGHGVGGEDDLADRRLPLPDADGRARLTEREQLFARGFEVDGRVAGTGVVQGELDGAVGEVAPLDAGDLGARELGAAHHLDDPADLGPGDRGGQAVTRGA